MAWFKKKKEEELLPDLPDSHVELPELPELPNQNPPQITEQKLPPLPETDTSNQQAIKQEINPNEMQKSGFEPITPQESLPPPPQPPLDPIKAEPTEMIEEPKIVEEPRTLEISEKTRGFSKPLTKKSEPIYVRLDKFQITVQAFDNIRDKINEIEKLLAKAKEIKQKEEKELEEWEYEIQLIKSRIDSIDKSIFNKLD